MKLGLYGGGFKPFHTGHFAKLLLALDESDKVLSFFGIKKQRLSKSKRNPGKPLKTDFREFGNTGRAFDQKMQEKVVSIYEKALQKAFPDVLDVVPSADITPITNVHSMLDRFAYSQMTDEERHEIGSNEVIPELTYQSSDEDGDSIKIDFVDFDEIVVVAGEEEINGPVYMGAINRRAERGDSRIGEKVKELVDLGRIKLKSGMADQSRLVDLLRQYHPDASDDMITVRGTGVRDLAGNRDVDELIRYLPNILPQEQKDEIVKILVGEAPQENQSESFFMPIITDSTILKAAARFTAHKKIVEAPAPALYKKKKGEGHILGLAEDMNLTFENLRQLIDDVFWGRVEHVEEKMDGQNFTFTVLDDGEIRLFGKGVSSTTLDKGGLNRQNIETHPSWSESVKDAFGSGYDVVETYLQTKDNDAIKRLFQNGRVVIEGQIMTPVNPNTIPYTENHVRFVRPFTPDNVEIDMGAYSELFGDADVEIQDDQDRSWSFGPVPKLTQTQEDASEIARKIQELERDIDNLLQGMSPVPQTVGDYASQVMEDYVEKVAPQIDLSALNPDQRRRAMIRLATGDKQVIGKPELREVWPEFQKFEKMRTAHVAAAIVDLEKIVQKLGSYFFDTLEFALATNEDVVADLAAEVEKIKQARDSDSIVIKNVDTGEVADLIDTDWATKLDTSLARIEQMGLFKKAVEGVVLRMPGPEGEEIVRKLTGMFTPVHRLVSLFRYPDRKSRNVLSIADIDEEEPPSYELTGDETRALSEALRVFAGKLNESGNAFAHRDERGRAIGEPVTSSERLSRATANKIIDIVINNVIKPLGLEPIRYAGSTENDPDLLGATPKEELGDVDIVVSVEGGEAGTLIAKLEGLPYLQDELVEGIPRIYKLGFGQGTGASIMVEVDGTYYQVDLFASTEESVGDLAWELSGGGEGMVKGEYHKLMFSMLAKIKGERESTHDSMVKYTLQFPGGWREKSGKDKKSLLLTKHIRDPDDYLPLLGINVESKKEVRIFERLIDYMVDANTDEFREALERFEEYIGSRLGSNNERTRAAAQQAIDYINSVYSAGSHSSLSETYVRSVIRRLIAESAETTSSIPLAKIVWSEKLKMFSSGKWNLWNERASATADKGKDPEGAEKAVAAMENLIYLGHEGYAIIGQADGGILIQGHGINAKLDADEAVEYIIGIRTSEDSDGPELPRVKIKHVAGTKPYDLELAETQIALEVKKMGSKDKLSKLGSASGRLFDRHVKIIRPLRAAGQIAQKFIEPGNITDSKTGEAIIRKIENPPESLDVEGVANAVEMVDYLFNRIKYSYSKTELLGVTIKVEGGQIPAGMVKRIKRSDFLNIDKMGNLFDVCTEVLNNNLGDYSPAKGSTGKLSSQDDGVNITAAAGGTEYEGKVSLDYFYDDLIFRLFDHTKEGVEIDESLILSYTACMEMLSEIYSPLAKINMSQGEDSFNEFISALSSKYGGFYGVASDHYYSVPCDVDHLDVYGTTQGFRAVLLIKTLPSEGPKIPEVKIKKPAEEEEVDLEISIPEEEDPGEEEVHADEEEIHYAEEEEEIDTEESDRTDT